MLADLVECRDQERSLSAFVAFGHELGGKIARHPVPAERGRPGRCHTDPSRSPTGSRGPPPASRRTRPRRPDHFIGIAWLAAGRQVVLESTVERFERRTAAFGSRVEGECEVMSPDELLADVSGLGLAQRVERSVHDIPATVDWRQVDGGRPGRDDGGYHTCLTPRAEPAPDDILAPDPRPMPVVLLARRRPRPPLRPEARPALPRGRPGPGPADRHHLDQGGQAQRPVSSPATSPSRPPASGPIASPDAC